MKIFETKNKVNFVDEDNTFLGYDMSQACCEHADWFISEKCESFIVKQTKEEKEIDFTGYKFDKGFHSEISNINEFDKGGMHIFKLTKENKPDIFIHIFNAHNGYYGHGFSFGIGEDPVCYNAKHPIVEDTI